MAYDSFRSTTDVWQSTPDDKWHINITLTSLSAQVFTWSQASPTLAVTQLPDDQTYTFSQVGLTPESRTSPSSLTYTWEQQAIAALKVIQLPAAQVWTYSQAEPQIQAIIRDTWADTEADVWADTAADKWFVYGAVLIRVQPDALTYTWEQQTPTLVKSTKAFPDAQTITWYQKDIANITISLYQIILFLESFCSFFCQRAKICGFITRRTWSMGCDLSIRVGV